MSEWEQKGYDHFIELCVQFGRQPSASECPARYMENGSENRSEYLKGWLKAREEW